MYIVKNHSSIKKNLLKKKKNLYAEYIMWNARLDKAHAGIKITGRNTKNLRQSNDNYPYGRKQTGTKEPLDENETKSEKTGLKLYIQKTKIMASGPITSWQVDGETMETVRDYFLGLQNHCRWWLQSWN